MAMSRYAHEYYMYKSFPILSLVPLTLFLVLLTSVVFLKMLLTLAATLLSAALVDAAYVLPVSLLPFDVLWIKTSRRKLCQTPSSKGIERISLAKCASRGENMCLVESS